MRVDMMRVALLAVGAAVVLTGVCRALVEFANEGHWPDTWPEALEVHRTDARTIGAPIGMRETQYAIPFWNRDEFEAA